MTQWKNQARTGLLANAATVREQPWLKYVMASSCALFADAGLFFLLLFAACPALIATTIGYLTGIAVHWLISSRSVFTDGTAPRGSNHRQRQKAMFFGSALVGLALTALIVGGADSAGFDPRLAKLVAIVVSFQATYLLRRHVVFFSNPTA